MTIRVAVVDDHKFVTDAMSAFFAAHRDIELVGSVNVADEAVVLVQSTRPDVLVLDLNMPKGDGRSVLRRLRRDGDQVPTIVVTGTDDLEAVQDVLALGARGFVTKTRTSDELIAAIRAVHEGQTYIGADIAAKPVDPEQLERREALSEREHEVLRLVSFGYTNKEISKKLKLSIKTIEAYRARVMSKLGAVNRADLVHHALRMGLMRQEG